MISRRLFFTLLACLLFLVLEGRLVYLQVFQGQANRAVSDGNRIRRLVEPAPRGLIYDRHNRLLTHNLPEYRSESGPLEMTIRRQYLYGPALALLGYVDQNGLPVTGLEKDFDSTLAGQAGGEIVEVDTFGRRQRVLGSQPVRDGRDLHLTLDARLSQIAHEALDGQTGAVVVTKVGSGEVLAAVFSPAFDPNIFGQNTSPEAIGKLLTDPQKPFFNRALSATYPPGSIFKIVTATAALEEGKITGQTLITDAGFIRIGDFLYRNWYFTQYGRTEGEINVVKALSRSTDTFFYDLGGRLGAESLLTWAAKFGLGKVTGLNLTGEAGGHLPAIDRRWYLGNLYHLGIGQGEISLTPLQANVLASVIANAGQLCPLKILKDDVSVKCQDLSLKKETLKLIKEGMIGACSPGGTAWPLFDFEPQVACKTGTAETGDNKTTHAWLVAFAPATEPEIVISVVVEKGGEGSTVAAPIAKKVLEAWFGE